MQIEYHALFVQSMFINQARKIGRQALYHRKLKPEVWSGNKLYEGFAFFLQVEIKLKSEIPP